jgi:FMN phosphatase YigB (HAD superfamily)
MRRLFILDLGGVIFPVEMNNFYSALDAQVQGEKRVEQALKQLEKDWEQFEEGRLSGADFWVRFCDEVRVTIPLANFTTAWNSIYLDAYRGIGEQIKALKQFGSVIAFTNTNSLHTPVWRERYSAECLLFDLIYSSHEIGIRKPRIEAFDIILSDYRSERRENIAFVDDTAANVLAAQTVGLFALQADPKFGLESVAEQLLCWARG